MFFYRYQTLIFAFCVGSLLLMVFWMVYVTAAQNRAQAAVKESLERGRRIEERTNESLELQRRLLALHEAQLEQQRETNRLLAQLVAERQQLV
jgi:hypothetical protein